MLAILGGMGGFGEAGLETLGPVLLRFASKTPFSFSRDLQLFSLLLALRSVQHPDLPSTSSYIEFFFRSVLALRGFDLIYSDGTGG